MDICFQVYPKGSNHELDVYNPYATSLGLKINYTPNYSLNPNPTSFGLPVSNNGFTDPYNWQETIDNFGNSNNSDKKGLKFNFYPKNAGISSVISTAGNVLNTAANDRIAMNASDNAVLGNAVSGNDIYDLFNNDKFYQGLENVRDNRIDYSNVKNNYNLYNAWNPNNFQDNIHYAQNGGHQYAFGDDMNHVGSILGSTAELAGIGTMIAPGIGTVIGAGLGAAMGVVNDIKNRRNKELLNNEIDRQNALQTENYYDTASLNNQRQLRNNMYNIFQQGGYIPNDNNITEFNTGGTHQQNPYGGIQQGIASDGKPNYVEESEVRYNDYIYSARNIPSESLLKKYNLI